MKRVVWFLYLLLAISLSFLFSCAGTQSDPYAEEELFPGENEKGTSAESEEDEVLRLLGITDEDTQSEPQQEPERQSTALENEIRDLENKVAEQDRQLDNLKSELDKKEDQIKAEQTKLTQSSTAAEYTRPAVRPSTSFRSRYDQALALYNSRRYRESISAFNQLLASGGDNSLLDNCQYWKGECYYGLMNYEQAILEFQKVFAFPNSNKLDDAQLKLGLCYIQLDNRTQARSEFNKLLQEYPDSEYRGRARDYLSRL